jgi:hypothetical protein
MQQEMLSVNRCYISFGKEPMHHIDHQSR